MLFDDLNYVRSLAVAFLIFAQLILHNATAMPKE
ncbi:hypothetical protein THIARS_70170 [Thiomonas delicata]|uniref:Uncharacterized protein n=1 Tax=Thiomonas delicata TaxID=364030 RepID=A0A238D5V9_THIDL|nr:hypothetical protein THIARS_70170 [Thiomonas delicata]